MCLKAQKKWPVQTTTGTLFLSLLRRLSPLRTPASSRLPQQSSHLPYISGRLVRKLDQTHTRMNDVPLSTSLTWFPPLRRLLRRRLSQVAARMFYYYHCLFIMTTCTMALINRTISTSSTTNASSIPGMKPAITILDCIRGSIIKDLNLCLLPTL